MAAKVRVPARSLHARTDGDFDLDLTPEVLALVNAPGDLGQVAGDIDAWNLRARGDWHIFTARLDPNLGPRDYRRSRDMGDIIADAPGPLWAHLAIGGPRRAGFVPGPPRFAHHILAPGDHLHSVGLEGTGQTTATAQLQRIPHRSLEALLADRLLSWRAVQGRALPLHVVRVETDAAPGPGSTAFQNFCTALNSLQAAARSLGTYARVGSIGIERVQGADAAQIATGTRDLMAAIEAELHARGLPRAPFVLFAEGGDHPAAMAHWELAWSHRPQRLIIPGPTYCIEQTEFARPTDRGLARMADLTAHALTTTGWHCPIPLLAEVRRKRLRVICQSMQGLVLEPDQPHGFAISGVAKPVGIEAVEIASDDPRALILTLDRQIDGDRPVLTYACGATTSGALRDDWSAPFDHGTLHRWALPATLNIHQAEG